MASWTVLSMLQTTAAYFQKLGLQSARLDADVLLAHQLGMRRFDLYLNTDKPLLADEVDAFRELVRRRAQREPVAYILGQREFYSIEFEVGPGVLIPRPETELLVDKGLEVLRATETSPPIVLDLCTGTGAIPIALLMNHPTARALAVDLSPEALTWAARNQARHKLDTRLALLQGDLLSPVPQRFKGKIDLLTSNPPYLTASEMATLSPDVAHEPHLALDGGAAGLDLYARLAAEALPWLTPTGTLLMEIGAGQGQEVAALLEANGFERAEILEDLAHLPRLVRARRPG